MSIANDVQTVKTILEIEGDDQNQVLAILCSNIQKAILITVGMNVSDVFPSDLDFITQEIACSRYNQLNSEGLKLESTDVTRMDYTADIYANYRQYLIKWKTANGLGTGKLRLI
ncbi:hypothetical protein H8486_002910 [Listeria monocytogenes]|uniref:phage head-tail connector protein n=1 Tax=Listeria monocytogenes TaxID=1639 RepID=UPI00199B867C|nr:phage head-tail connector protein [Listeria monocytogenes]EGX6726905.1 hypothetical protein [Listeria innocua]EGC1212259.1 hypothetical protein [Listeria monocytogenes]EGC1215218.1 hypothetical protein [Listeria monocytogenes]EGX6739287.1 hypothetical protein [Listeria innocua]MCD2223044.1 phage head-tail connector protein [Listeria monocytogenes]